MSPRLAAGGSGENPLVDLAFAAAGTLLGFAAVLWAGAAAATYPTSGHLPRGPLTSPLRALHHPGDPAAAWPTGSGVPGPLLYWAGTFLVVVAAAALAGCGWVAWQRHQPGHTTRQPDVRRLPGLARHPELLRLAGRRALLRRASQLRPTLQIHDAENAEWTSEPQPPHDQGLPGIRRRHGTAPQQLGYRIGRLGLSRRSDVWASVEDSVVILGPPRMGKGLHLVIPWVLDAPGPVVTTSTRPDTLAVTHDARAKAGPIAIFDPQQLTGLPGGLRWSPIRGCQHPRTAIVRARGLAASSGWTRGTVSDGDFWSGQTEAALRGLLHAAAIGCRRATDLYRWALNPASADDAVTLLANHADAIPGWADALDAQIHADPRTRDSVWLGVRQALAALADPHVLDTLDPPPGEGFDPTTFLRENGTLYLLATAVGAGASAPLVAALLEDLTETARTLAARSVGARLDPPLLLALDEIANLTPLPSLPSLMAEGGGTGITTVTVLQSLAQARDRWGEHAADAIWDAATVKIVLGGLARMRDLDDLARLLGDRDEPTATRTRGAAGERSTSVSMRRVAVMPPDLLRSLPFGTAALLLRQARPTVLDLQPWTDRKDADQLRQAQRDVERLSRDAATSR